MKKACNGPDGKKTMDLTLKNVAFIPNFHVNIISANLMKKANLWLRGYDDTIQWGPPEALTTITDLILREELNFVEYCPVSPRGLHSSNACTVSFPQNTVNATIRRVLHGQHRSKEAIKEREASLELWHLRTGHLSSAAMDHLLRNVKGVRLTTTSLKDCQSFRVEKAKNVVSRRAPETRSQQPFYRISIDFFMQPRGYNDDRYLLPILEEYSGMIYGITMKQRSDGPPLMIQFVGWVCKSSDRLLEHPRIWNTNPHI